MLIFYIIAIIAALASIANLARFMVALRNGRRWFNLWLGLVSGYIAVAYVLIIAGGAIPHLMDVSRVVTVATMASYLGFALSEC